MVNKKLKIFMLCQRIAVDVSMLIVLFLILSSLDVSDFSNYELRMFIMVFFIFLLLWWKL